MKLLKRIAGVLASSGQRQLYRGLLLPRDDYVLRYYGHQYGRLVPHDVAELFPTLSSSASATVHGLAGFTPGTSLEVSELVVLLRLLDTVQAQRVLEIGTFTGLTALNIAQHRPEAEVITVDLPPSGMDAEPPAGYRNQTAESEVGKHFRDDSSLNIRQLLADSMTLDWGSLPGPFDVIFIDGCHHRAAVASDSTNAFTVVAPGGLVVWHDYGQSKDVSVVVDQLAKVKRIHALRGTRLAVYQHVE